MKWALKDLLGGALSKGAIYWALAPCLGRNHKGGTSGSVQQGQSSEKWSEIFRGKIPDLKSQFVKTKGFCKLH